MRRKNRKCRHSIHRKRWRNIRRQALSKERDPPLSFASGWEKLALEVLVILRDEEGRSTQAAASAGARIDLVVKQLLDMIDREQVFAVHRDNDGVPDLRDKHLQRSQDISIKGNTGEEMEIYLWLILDLHILRGQKLGINPLGQTGINILPGGPDRETQYKRPRNTKHRIPNDIPKEGIQKEEHEIHDIHDRQRERRLVGAQCIAKEPIGASLDFHPYHDLDGFAEGGGEEEIRFNEFAAEDE